MASTLVAIAVHEQVAGAKLAQLERTDPNQMFGSGTGTCPRCGATFAIIFMSDFNKDNQKFAARLEQLIGEDCNEGKHALEIVLNKDGD
jgi:hypothetical protein